VTSGHQPVSHPMFARLYAWLSPKMEQAGVAQLRQRLLAGLTGRVVEVGAGNGLNFRHYPPEVTGVVAVEPEPRLRAIAHQAAQQATVPVQVVDGLAQALPLPDASVDAAVVSLVLCSVPSQADALAELCRVLRPGGQVRFLEHVAAEPGSSMRRAQQVVDRFLWPRLFGGCRTGRDTVAAMEQAGFRIEELSRFRFPPRSVFPSAPHVLGRAVRTDAEP